MKYTISYHNSHDEEYVAKDANGRCIHTTTETYTVEGLELCKSVLQDFLDSPTRELALDVIVNDFSSGENRLSEEQAIKIQNYYNGRFALYNSIVADLENNGSQMTYKYDIPEKYNTFAFSNDDSKQLASYIMIQKV